MNAPTDFRQALGLARIGRDTAQWPRVEVVFNHAGASGPPADLGDHLRHRSAERRTGRWVAEAAPSSSSVRFGKFTRRSPGMVGIDADAEQIEGGRR